MSTDAAPRRVRPPRRWPLGKAALILGLLCGAALGVGLFAFDYGEGLSYFSTDPKNCANCHIMQEHYNSWQKAGHHQLGANGQPVATCVDCHLPHDFVGKYLAKADNGYRHSWAFTFQDFHEPIQMTPRNARILQNNCVTCHGDFVHAVVGGTGGRDELRCVHCHSDVGHGPRTGLGR